tara:strand:+ start:868 stop:1290 length:423 start_codon:yes stop_codon:yes gene_type:complete
MANKRLGSTASFSGSVAYQLDATCNLDGFGKSGGVFFLKEGSAAYTITLPAVSNSAWHGKFIVQASPASYAITIASVDGDDIKGIEFADDDSAAATDSDWDSVTVSTNAVAGDYVEFVSDGTNWYAHMHASADNAFTQTD